MAAHTESPTDTIAIQGLDSAVEGPVLVGDPIEMSFTDGRITDEQPIPTDQLILEGSAESPAESMADFERETLEQAAEPPVPPSRLEQLAAAIERHPQSPANYVLRGELYLDARNYALAEADFLRALELSEQGAETADWGYIHRAFNDRAREGLRRCR